MGHGVWACMGRCHVGFVSLPSIDGEAFVGLTAMPPRYAWRKVRATGRSRLGRTRRRVTVLVLTLESLGLLLLVSSVYIAGGQRLRCDPNTVGRHDCTFVQQRVLGLLPVGEIRIDNVSGARVEGDGGVAHLVLETSAGDRRVASIGEQRLRGDVALLRAAFESREALVLAWSDVLLAVAMGAFGLLWLTLMVLIMREFLGYHTPWWWRVLRGR